MDLEEQCVNGVDRWQDPVHLGAEATGKVFFRIAFAFWRNLNGEVAKAWTKEDV